MAAAKTTSLDHVVETLVEQAVAGQDVPRDVALTAAMATKRKFAGLRCDARLRYRVRAYFATVVRNRVVRAGSDGTAAARLVIASVVADLAASGRDSLAVWHEIERGWAGIVPASVLEEYRTRLCA
jgi:hypothetical protein